MDEADESRPVADRAESARQARSNYLVYLAGVGVSVVSGILFKVADSAGQEPVGPTLLLAGSLIGLSAFALLIIGLVRAYAGRKKAEEVTASHFRVQVRTFWISLLYSVAVALFITILIPEVAEIVDWIAWIAVDGWFVFRCIKGLAYLIRRQPYPNPGTWLW